LGEGKATTNRAERIRRENSLLLVAQRGKKIDALQYSRKASSLGCPSMLTVGGKQMLTEMPLPEGKRERGNTPKTGGVMGQRIDTK